MVCTLIIVAKVVTAIIFAGAFIVPLFYTYIPYWRTIGRPSGALTSRMLVRLVLFMLAVNEVVELAEPQVYDHEASSLLLLIITAIVLIWTWRKHPDGIKGL